MVLKVALLVTAAQAFRGLCGNGVSGGTGGTGGNGGSVNPF